MDAPPPALVALLGRLDLPAQAAAANAVLRRVRQLAGELPRFETIWVDALAQQQILTPWQARQVNAGRGNQLRVGPMVLLQALRSPGFAPCYLARPAGSRRLLRLALVPWRGQAAQVSTAELERLIERSRSVHSPHVATIEQAGIEDDAVWAACRHVAGETADQWMVRNGRFPPDAALHLARSIASGLAAIEQAGLVHGDLSAAQVVIGRRGEVVLPLPGLRPLLHPHEGFAWADLPPEEYDYLAPERIVDATGPSTAADVYACGLVFWHLLAGRTPIAGGNRLLKLRSAALGRVEDVRNWAHDAPAPLVEAIRACLAHDCRQRPASMAQLRELLGSSTAHRRRAVETVRLGRTGVGWYAAPVDRRIAWRRRASRLAVAAAVVGFITAISWPFWRSAPRPMALVAPGPGTAANQPGDEAAQSDPRPRPPSPTPAVQDEPLVLLDPERRVRWESLEIPPGATVRPPPGQRALVAAPPGGVVLHAEGVRLVNIDFVCEALPDPSAALDPSGASPALGSRGAAPALVRLAATRVEFQGCTFRGPRGAANPPVAVRCDGADGAAHGELLRSARVRLVDCVLDGVAAGVEGPDAAALSLEALNTLCIGPGPLLRLARWPTVEDPVVVSLGRVTLRSAQALIECRYDTLEASPGRLAVRAVDCALAPANTGALIVLSGSDRPDALVRAAEWSGEGCVLDAAAEVLAWHPPGAARQVLDDEQLRAAGLVRSRLEFAGSSDGGPAASVLVRWQGPVRSAAAPGIDAARLAMPELSPQAPRRR